MEVVNLTAWAGEDFSFLPGQIIDLPDETALGRVEAGLAAWPKGTTPPAAPAVDGEDAPSTGTDASAQDDPAAPTEEPPPAEGTPPGEEPPVGGEGGEAAAGRKRQPRA